MTATERLIRSPYLQAVPDALIPKVLVEAAGVGRDACRSDGLRCVIDLSNDRVFMMSSAELTVPEQLESESAVTQVAHSSPEMHRRLVECGLLIDAEAAFRRHCYETVEIEINRHCNFRCKFCPVELAPKPRAFMDTALFALVVERAAEYGARQISLNHYSEPTLNPGLIDNIA
jgi:hypothetical protein